MGIVLFAIGFVSGFLFVFAFTGGLASAIAAGGREDHPLWQNAVIGFVGWSGAMLVWRAVTGDVPEEFQLGMALLALAISIVVARSWDRRAQMRSAPLHRE